MANLGDVPPTVYFNVPAGYAQLISVLENDAEFAPLFSPGSDSCSTPGRRCRKSLRDRLGAVAGKTTGRVIPVTGSWGPTETAPAVTSAHSSTPTPVHRGAVARRGGQARPGRGRVRDPGAGPMVTPGYFARPDLTKTAFDKDGYYRTGDAVVLDDPDHPERGLAFAGRIAEDFKLTTGTFVRVGVLRTGAAVRDPRC